MGARPPKKVINQLTQQPPTQNRFGSLMEEEEGEELGVTIEPSNSWVEGQAVADSLGALGKGGQGWAGESQDDTSLSPTSAQEEPASSPAEASLSQAPTQKNDNLEAILEGVEEGPEQKSSPSPNKRDRRTQEGPTKGVALRKKPEVEQPPKKKGTNKKGSPVKETMKHHFHPTTTNRNILSGNSRNS
jgi:hypothetical protein